MSQVTLYIDKETLKQIEAAAKMEGCSVSKWVKRKLTEALENTWPQNYFELFGSLAEEKLERPPQGEVSKDLPRRKL